MHWAENAWTDEQTGAQVVCLSPPRKSHFRTNYHRINMFTADGRYAVLYEHEDIRDGEPAGTQRLWARDMVTGELRDLGEAPVDAFHPSLTQYALHFLTQWEVAPQSHTVHVIDSRDNESAAIIQIDLDTGRRRRIQPSRRLPYIWGAVGADERTMYMNWSYQRKLGEQEILGIDLRTGQVDTLWVEHTTPISVHAYAHPTNPEIVLFNFDPVRRRYHAWPEPTPAHRGMECTHWSIARGGNRWYGHVKYETHMISRRDYVTGEHNWYVCRFGESNATHTTIAPDESFLVGDGFNFDCTTITPAIAQQIEEAKQRWGAKIWCQFPSDHLRDNGGEMIWKYDLPARSVFDYQRHWKGRGNLNVERLQEDIEAHPEQAVRSTAVCRFRTLARSKMMGHRLEANARATPDSGWVVFQSSSEDGWFEVWAARVPGRS